MKILGMGMPELLIILAVVLLIFGPKNLPKLGSSLGKTVKGLREGLSDNKEAENAKLSAEDEETVEDEVVAEQSSSQPVKKTVKAKKASV